MNVVIKFVLVYYRFTVKLKVNYVFISGSFFGSELNRKNLNGNSEGDKEIKGEGVRERIQKGHVCVFEREKDSPQIATKPVRAIKQDIMALQIYTV